MRKKILAGLAVVILLPLAMLAAGSVLLYAQRDALLDKLLAVVNDSIDGTMSIGSLRIAPFDNFPYVSVDL